MPSFPGLLALLIVAMLVAVPNGASAHAIILSSSPAAGATVPGDAVAIRLHFNSRIDRARSKLTLVAPDGAAQELKPMADAPADELDGPVKALPAGPWRLRWQVLSVDGHITRGDIPFTVR